MTTKLLILNNSNHSALRKILKELASGDNPPVALMEAPTSNQPYILLDSPQDNPLAPITLTAVFPESTPLALPPVTMADPDLVRSNLLLLSRWGDIQGHWCYTELLRKVRHDLRAPLNIILGFSGSLLQKDSWAPQDESKIKAIQEAGENLLLLINSLYTAHSGSPSLAEKPLRKKIPELEPDQKDLVILVVDDQASNRQVLMDMLKPTGALLTQAASVSQAIKAAEEVHPTLIFMDCYMPGESGIQGTGSLLALYKDHEEPPKIIGITASDDGNEKEAFMAAGAVDVLNKPLSEGVLVQCLIRYAGRNWKPGKESSHDNAAGMIPPPYSLAEEWRLELTSALDCGSISKLKQLSLEIRETLPDLGSFLSERASQYDLGSVKAWLDRAREHP